MRARGGDGAGRRAGAGKGLASRRGRRVEGVAALGARDGVVEALLGILRLAAVKIDQARGHGPGRGRRAGGPACGVPEIGGAAAAGVVGEASAGLGAWGRGFCRLDEAVGGDDLAARRGVALSARVDCARADAILSGRLQCASARSPMRERPIAKLKHAAEHA